MLKKENQKQLKKLKKIIYEKNKLIDQLKKQNKNIKLENNDLVKERNCLKTKYNNLKKRYHDIELKNKSSVSKGKKSYVFMRDKHSCLACGTKENLTLDHIIPRSKGGSNDVDNLQVLCQHCNLAKGTNNLDFRNNKIEPLIKKK